jgi:Epoxide hydrolase N terminus
VTEEQPMPQPFTLRVPDSDIADLRERLARTRFPNSAPGEPWLYGTDVDYMRGLVEYWRGPLIGARRRRG